MLDERTIEKLCERLVDRIEQGNTYILEEIGKNIKKIGKLSPSRARQLAQILKYGGNYNKILEKLEKITELNIKDIEDIFQSVAKENYMFAKQFYDYRGIEFIPYEKNFALINQVKALSLITAQEYINFSNTHVLGYTIKEINGILKFSDISDTYQRLIDEAVLNIAQGKDTTQNQMRKIIKQIGESGLKTVDYISGYSRRLDSAVRMNIQGALRDLSNTMQRQFGREYGADGIEISVHEHPAPDHENIQGHQYSLEQFNRLNESLERHISQLNCYHYTFNIILGVNKPLYTEEQLNEILQRNKDGFELDGKHYTLYEGTQMQRALETKIRQQKDVQILAKSSGDKIVTRETQQKITELTNKYKELSKISGLGTKMERLRVTGYKRIDVNKM